jgi:membrane protein required for colicin V production
MTGFTWIDIVIIAILGLSTLISLFRGFVKETFSLASWAAAFLAALSFGHQISEEYLLNYIHSPTVRLITAYGSLFLITLILCSIVTYFISRLVHKTGLSGTDRLLGVIFGGARGVLLIAALLLVAKLTPFPQEEVWKNSFLVPRFEPVEVWLKNILPESMSKRFELTNTDEKPKMLKSATE